MIRFTNSNDIKPLKKLWKICFGDSDEYIDLHFSEKYKDENTLIYWENNKIVAALYMTPYCFRFYGELIPFYYLAGLSTLSEYRSKGFMSKLIKESFEVMKNRNIPLCGLVPAEEWLFNYYSKYGFTTIFNENDTNINLKEILSNNIEDAFLLFEKQYQQADFTVLKNFEDFKTLVKDLKADNYPIKRNLKGMARAIVPINLLQIYAEKNLDKELAITVEDEHYIIENGKVTQGNFSDNILYKEMHIKTFTELLFKDKNATINLMME